MKKGKKKLLGISVILLLFFALNLTFVLAQNNPLEGTIDSARDIFNLDGSTREVLVALFIAIIIGASLYDILGFTAFENKWVKLLIAFGIAGIALITNIIRKIGDIAFSFAGGATIVGVTVVILAGIGLFVGIHFGLSKGLVAMLKAKGDVEAERAAKEAKVSAAKLRGTTEGL